MQVVLRPANDAFLHAVVFPGLAHGLHDAAGALEFWDQLLDDPNLAGVLELLHDLGAPTLPALDHPKWPPLLYALLFDDWSEEGDRWRRGDAAVGYAGDLDHTLHLALLLEEPSYPYADPAEARAWRASFMERPQLRLGLSSLLCGHWDPPPDFAPHAVLSTVGRGAYEPHRGLARADWCTRSAKHVNRWAAQLPSALSALLAREERRLAPVEIPERHEVLGYWLGRHESAPLLAVTFSGLGPDGVETLRELGRLARFLRLIAERQQAVTAVLSRPMAAPGR